jgi:MFS family permease
MQNTAQVLLVYKLTRSVFAVGLVVCAQFSGALLFGPWAAVVARRVGRKRMLIAAQLASAVIAGLLAVMQARGTLREGALIVGALSLGLVYTFALPVQTALVPRLVPETPAAAEAAMAMNSVSYNAGRAVAPVICVLVIVTNGFAWAFAANAISFVIFAAVLVKTRQCQPSTKKGLPVQARRGIHIAFESPRVILLLAIIATVTFADDPVLIQGPALAHALHASNDLPGYFLAALGLGTVLGSLKIAHPKGWSPSDTTRRAARSLVFLFVFIVVFAAGFATWICLLAAFAAGVAVLNIGALAQAELSRQRPKYTASVMALWAIAWAGTKPLASLLDGWLSSHTYLWLAATLLAAPALILALLELYLRPETKKKIKKFWYQQRAKRANIQGLRNEAAISIPKIT